MKFDNEEYAWRFTGYPWLDGIIFGGGSPKTAMSITIKINELPYSMSEKIKNEFISIGYQADYIEFPNAMTKEMDLRLCVAGPSPIFKILPRFKERRLDMEHTQIEFIQGYFTVCCAAKLEKYSRLKTYSDGLMIKTGLPHEDVLQLLNILGVEEYKELGKNLYLERESFKGIAPFEEIFNEAKLEDDGFSSYMPGREDNLAEAIDGLINEMDNGNPIGIDHCEIESFKETCPICDKLTMHKKETKNGETRTWCVECIHITTGKKAARLKVRKQKLIDFHYPAGES
jgi:hypothetical protein